jgi:opacity protein-like surface antigen
MRRLVWTVGFALATASVAPAQEAQGPPPAPVDRGASGLAVHELLPDLGVIGAQVGLLGGSCRQPYATGTGACGGGFVALPLARVGSSRLSYEISVSLGHARSDPFTITNPIAVVANLAAGASSTAAAQGPPAAPFPVRRLVRTDLRVLSVSPFGLRLALGSGPVRRLRPYVLAGVDAVVVISTQDPVERRGPDVAGAPVFDDPQIGGLVAQSPELAALGLPTGQGSLRVGGHAGAGVEVRFSERLSLNPEYRFTAIEGAGGGTHAVTGAVGFHW